jgi:hypothetical protein
MLFVGISLLRKQRPPAAFASLAVRCRVLTRRALIVGILGNMENIGA